MELTGPKVSIRPVALANLPALCRWWNDLVVMREVRAERLRPSLDSILSKSWPVWRNPGPDQYHLFVICLSGRPVGEIGYIFEDLTERRASLDIKIGEPALWSQGSGTEAMRLFVAYLLAEVKAERLIAQPGDWNRRSIRLFEKCGFRETGRPSVSANYYFDGGTAVTMALARAAFESTKQGALTPRTPSPAAAEEGEMYLERVLRPLS